MLRPSPNHGTQRLPNDDDDDEKVKQSSNRRTYGYRPQQIACPEKVRGQV